MKTDRLQPAVLHAQGVKSQLSWIELYVSGIANGTCPNSKIC